MKVFWRGAVALLLALILSLAGVAPTGLYSLAAIDYGSQDSATYTYYEVEGDSFSALKQSIAARGPVDQFGVRRDAYTSWHIRWEWPRASNGAPILKDTIAYADVEVIVPSLSEEAELSSSERAEWDRYLAAVLSHEDRHVKLALNMRAKIQKKIRDLVRSTRAVSASRANAIGYRLLEELRKEDQRFDVDTDHGRREGVYLP